MIKKLLSITAAALLLTSCSQSTDGYFFEKGSTLLPEKEIHVVMHHNIAELKAAYAVTHASPVAEDRDLRAFSIIGPKVCTIHVIDPKVTYMPEFVGHELVHCLYGEFHPSQNG